LSWQAFQAVRDHSESRGATRTVGLVLASYAQPDGGSVHPSIKTIAEKAKVSRSTAIEARRWFLDHGEAEQVGTHPTATGSPIPDLSFRPLLQKGPDSGPFEGEGSGQRTLKGPGSEQKGPLSEQKGPDSGPEPKGNQSTKTTSPPPPEGEKTDSHSLEAKRRGRAEQRQVEEREQELEALRAQLPRLAGARHAQTERAIASLEAEAKRDDLSDLAGPAEVEARLAEEHRQATARALKPRHVCDCGGTDDGSGTCLACSKRKELVPA
jgi:hypothetical protein